MTVLMAVYNGEPFVGESIASVLGQTFAGFRFLVVDDASTDGTPRVLEAHAARDPRIRVVRNRANMGLTRSLNRGLGLIETEYVARQDADDLSRPERLERQLAFLDRNPAVGLVGTAYTKIDERGRETGEKRLPCRSLDLRWALVFVNAFMHGSVTVRRSALAAVGGLYDERFRYAQDYDLWSRISRSFEVANLPDPLACYRTTTSSLSSTFVRPGDEIFAISRRNVAELLSGRAGPDWDDDAFVELAQQLLFGDPSGGSSEAARRAAADILGLQASFADRYEVPARDRVGQRAAVLRRLAACLRVLGRRDRDRRALGTAATLFTRALLLHAAAAALPRGSLSTRLG